MGKHPLTLLIMATLLEAKPFVSELELEPVSEKPFSVFKNEHLVLVVSGIGKAHAAAATTYGCLTFSPKRVINAGAAGALDADHPAGAIYQINKVVEHDRPDIFTGQPVCHEPDHLDGVHTAVLATGDRPVIDPDDRSHLAALAGLVDMEAAAVVQTCRSMALPCFVFKFVSDEPGHTAGADIVNNIRIFRASLFEFFVTTVLPGLEAE